MTIQLSTINRGKAVFDDIYIADDPRGYFSVLGSLDYMIPDVAEPVVRQILAAHAAMHGQTPTVLDVGCSYGINAAVHRFPVSFASLRPRYAKRELMELPAAEMARLDRNFYAGWPDIGTARFIGVDSSEPAIRYANEVGLHDGGVTANLEVDELSPEDAALVAPADVLLSTGSVGYVTQKTYDKLLDAVTGSPWIISFVLRMFPYTEFVQAFERRGMVTERLAGASFVQRRFRDEEEFSRCIAALESQGIDPTGLESEGLFQAELFLSRPAADVKAASLEDIVTVSSGRFRAFGSRFIEVEDADGRRVAIEA